MKIIEKHSKIVEFENLILSKEATLHSAITSLNKSSAQLVLIEDENKKIIGTITDGDIRRAILDGKPLNANVKDSMNENFHFVRNTASEVEIIEIMKEYRLHQLPVLSDSDVLVDLILIDNLIGKSVNNLSNPVVIMAGGKGTRLMPLTKNCPKPMLKVRNKPMLEIIVEQCVEAGFNKIIISVNYLKEKIIDYFADGRDWGVNITYIEEDSELGTLGALSLIENKINSPFLLINGDVLTKVDFNKLLDFHINNDATMTLCVREHTTHIPYGVVNLEELSVISLSEKPILTNYVNAGIYLLSPKVLSYIPYNKFFNTTDLINLLIEDNKKIIAFPLHEYWMDIGHHENLELAHENWI